MAFNPAPSSWIASWAEDATNITVPIASFPQLTAAEADGTTGDIRKIMYALSEKMYAAYIALAVADRPAQMTITRSSSVNATTGVITHNYTFKFNNTIATQDVAAE